MKTHLVYISGIFTHLLEFFYYTIISIQVWLHWYSTHRLDMYHLNIMLYLMTIFNRPICVESFNYTKFGGLSTKILKNITTDNINLKDTWFMLDLKYNPSEVPNKKTLVSQKSTKTTLPPDKQHINSCATIPQHYIMNVDEVPDNNLHQHKPNVKKSPINKLVFSNQAIHFLLEHVTRLGQHRFVR